MKQLLAMVLALAWLAAAAATPPVVIEGRWEGVLNVQSSELKLAVNISRAVDGILLAALTDERNMTLPVDSIRQTDRTLRLEFAALDAVIEGQISPDDTKLKGTWTQGGESLPLELTRTAPPPEPTPPMATPAPASPPATAALELAVPFAPTPVAGDGKRHLAYELHITNLGMSPLQLGKLEVLDRGTPIAVFEGAELNNILQRPGMLTLLDRRALGPGVRAVAYLWLRFEADKPLPTTLRHRLTAAGRRTIEGVEIEVADASPLVLGPPLRGADWFASSGPGSTFGHRQALIAVNGKACVAQRYATDWIRMVSDSKTYAGDEKKNASYRAYGGDILAVADAVVASVYDGMPENVPGMTSRAVPITLDTIGGNYVVLDLGQGLFAFYAHMQPGSVRVKAGDRVHRGQVLGLVGNSGNSTQPHLHFHVMNGSVPLGAEGVPFVIDAFEVQAAAGGAWQSRRNEIPMNNARVRFPQ